MKKKFIYSSEYHLIDTNEINAATKELVDKLNLYGGSVGGFDIYSVVRAYFTDLKRREEINKIISGFY